MAFESSEAIYRELFVVGGCLSQGEAVVIDEVVQGRGGYAQEAIVQESHIGSEDRPVEPLEQDRQLDT